MLLSRRIISPSEVSNAGIQLQEKRGFERSIHHSPLERPIFVPFYKYSQLSKEYLEAEETSLIVIPSRRQEELLCSRSNPSTYIWRQSTSVHRHQ